MSRKYRKQWITIYFIVSRQFITIEHRTARLGTHSFNYTYDSFMNNVLTDPTMSLVEQQVVTNTSMGFSGNEMFARLICEF